MAEHPRLAALVDEVRSGLSEHTLDAVVEAARDTIPGCSWAGITVRRGHRFGTLASTGGPVEAVDRAQYEARQGPCVDAVVDDDVYLVPDMREETRWPSWTPRALDHGVLSVLSVPLVAGSTTVGGLNLYGAEPGAMGEDDLVDAVEFARAAARLLAVSHEITNLRTAMSTRRTIGAAQGILRHRYGVDLDEAQAILVRLSRTNNVKLALLAQEVVDANGVPSRLVDAAGTAG
ncbi:GAF and ANTAR domain-containing protein [Angustibacter speluncae]